MITHSDKLDRDFEFVLVHVGLELDDDWVSDHWTAIINSEPFNYYTGIGHRKIRSGCVVDGGVTYIELFQRYMFMPRGKWTDSDLIEFDKIFNVKSTPLLDDVLYSLVMNATLGQGTFEDWCSNWGSDVDNGKALSAYEVCQKTIGKLRKIGVTDLDKASEAFDY